MGCCLPRVGQHPVDAAVDLGEPLRNSWKSLLEVDDVVGCGAFAGYNNIVGVVSCSKGAGGGVVTKESTADSGYQRSKSGSFR